MQHPFLRRAVQHAGNTTTLAHYLELLAGAGMICGLQKYAGDQIRKRASSPKLLVLNSALMTSSSGRTFDEARQDPFFWGRLVESAVGAWLVNAGAQAGVEIYYWRERQHEVDFVLRRGKELVGIEVKSGTRKSHQPGLHALARAHDATRTLLVGDQGIPVNEFLSEPIEHWLSG